MKPEKKKIYEYTIFIKKIFQENTKIIYNSKTENYKLINLKELTNYFKN